MTAAVPGEGLLVATGDGHFLITQAQWEGEPEFSGPVLATWEDLVGEKFWLSGDKRVCPEKVVELVPFTLHVALPLLP